MVCKVQLTNQDGRRKNVFDLIGQFSGTLPCESNFRTYHKAKLFSYDFTFNTTLRSVSISSKKMTGCCVPGCNNSTRKGFSMRSFPTDRKRKALWIASIGKPNWEPTAHSRICEVHFSKDMWEKVRCDGKQKLKCNAVPTIFPSHQLKMNTNILLDNHEMKIENDIGSDNIMAAEQNSINLLPSISQAHANSCTNAEEEIDWKKQCEELRRLLKKSEETCTQLRDTMKKREEMFNKIIVKSDRYRRILKERLKKLKESDKNYKLKVILEKVLHRNQIVVFIGKDSKLSYETIKQAIDSSDTCGINIVQ